MNTGPGDLAAVAGLLADRARLLADQAAAAGQADEAGEAGEAGPDARTAPHAPRPAAGAPELDMVRLGRELGTLAGSVLRLAVQRAEASGHSWAEISQPLGVSPQAAFQRFGRPDGPAAGQSVPPVISDAADRAITVLADWMGERYEAVAATFDATMAEAFPVAGLAAARAHLAGTAGPYRRLGDQEPLVRQAGDYTVADVPLIFEAGVLKGRVTFDRAGRVAGLYVLPPATP